MKPALLNDMLDLWTQKLLTAGISTSRLDCLVLIEDATAKDRSWLLAHPEYLFPKKTVIKLQEQIERRTKHEPLAYIRGKAEFYGRKFIVNNAVLQPRPETEAMIEHMKEIVFSLRSTVDSLGLGIIDVGTGSGCLAVTAKLEFPDARVIATDISPTCLKFAKKNALSLGTNIKFYQGDLLQPIPPTAYHLLPTVLLANLPYVPIDYQINQSATFEPQQALFGGTDGLDYYRQMFDQINKLDIEPLFILTESIPFQHQQLEHIANSASYKLHKTVDFIQCFQMLN
jgi:release factor glutamine methyltransferase